MKTQLVFLIVIFLATPLVWVVPRQIAARTMMLVTTATFGWFAPFSLLLLLLSSTLQWLCWNVKWPLPARVRNGAPVLIPLAALVVYKLGATGANWLIPLGLSYYSFRQIHVAFEVYKQTMPRFSLLEYLEYLLFLPVILVGPIHRMPEFQRSLRRRKWDFMQVSAGPERILYGLVKVSFLGNFLFSIWLKNVAAQMDVSFLRLYVEIVSFVGNAYVQFAGFSDIAIGTGLLWGVRVMENFNAPFMATNMQMFWQRWHISLSSWCRDYVFQPIAGFSRNRWLALIASMLVLALWHEVSWRYICWGVVQALLILLTVRTRKLSPGLSAFVNEHPAGRWLGRMVVFHLFAFSCILIAGDTMQSIGPLINKYF